MNLAELTINSISRLTAGGKEEEKLLSVQATSNDGSCVSLRCELERAEDLHIGQVVLVNLAEPAGD